MNRDGEVPETVKEAKTEPDGLLVTEQGESTRLDLAVTDPGPPTDPTGLPFQASDRDDDLKLLAPTRFDADDAEIRPTTAGETVAKYHVASNPWKRAKTPVDGQPVEIRSATDPGGRGRGATTVDIVRPAPAVAPKPAKSAAIRTLKIVGIGLGAIACALLGLWMADLRGSTPAANAENPPEVPSSSTAAAAIPPSTPSSPTMVRPLESSPATMQAAPAPRSAESVKPTVEAAPNTPKNRGIRPPPSPANAPRAVPSDTIPPPTKAPPPKASTDVTPDHLKSDPPF